MPENPERAAHRSPKDVDPSLWEPKKKGFIGRQLAAVAGFGVTFRSIFRPVVTEQYPYKLTPTQPRYHGRHQLNRYEDGLEKCVGCELCAWACPADAIYVEAAANTPDNQYSAGERYGRVYQINYLRCIFCGMCIQACPTRALTMTTDYEFPDLETRADLTRREDLIYEKDKLLAPLAQGQLDTPHPMAAGTTDMDYYRGDVLGVTSDQVAWVAQNRPNDQSLKTVQVVDREASKQ